MSMRLREQERVLHCCVLETALSGLQPHRQHVEAVFSMLIHSLRHLTGEEVVPDEVRFRHSAPDNLAEHHAVFRGRLRFGRGKNEMILNSRYFSLPVITANREFLEVLDRFARSLERRVDGAEAWTAKTAERIGIMMKSGRKSNIEAVASGLCLGVRVLQNRLKAEGTTFHRILDRVRTDFAKDCLEREELSLTEIAFLTGFSEQSSFHHAFRRWTGQSPKKFRQEKKGDFLD